MRWVARVRHAHDHAGFSLVETLAALLVFGIITLGLIPLLAASLRGSDISRKAAVGKNIAIQAMERARGLPFYIDYNTQPRKVDVLDLYIPTLTPAFTSTNCTGFLATGTATCTQSGYQATGPSFITTCPNSANPACALNLPAGYTVTFDASFVGSLGTTPTETFADFASSNYPNYAYNSAANDRPPKLLVEMVITASWTATGRGARSYQIRTLLSDRRFSGLKVLGEATIDYGVKFVAGYSNVGAAINDSELTVTGGHSVSRIESRRVSTANQTVRAAEITLVDLVEAATDPANAFGGNPLTPVVGVESVQVAPPDVTVNPAQVPRQDVDHDSATYGEVSGMDITDSDNVSVAVAGGLPAASGEFHFSTSNNEDLWVSNKKTKQDLELEDEEDWIARVISAAGSERLEGSTSSTTSALGTQPSVISSASVQFEELRIFQTDDYIDDDTFDEAGIVVSGPRDVNGEPSGEFVATATCNAENDGTQNAAPAAASYDGTLWYWRDVTENDSNDDGQYEWVDLATGDSSELGPGTSASATLEALQSGAPIRVFDRIPDNKDVYLFDNGSNPFWLTDWSSLGTPTTSVAQNGRVTSASLDTALALETGPLEANEPDTALGILIGSVGCRAEDYR